MVTTRSGKTTTPSTPPKNSVAKPKREKRERAHDMIPCPLRSEHQKRGPILDDVFRVSLLLPGGFAAVPAGYSLRPRYGGDGFYIDRPKPKSKTSDTPGVRRSGKRPARNIFSFLHLRL